MCRNNNWSSATAVKADATFSTLATDAASLDDGSGGWKADENFIDYQVRKINDEIPKQQIDLISKKDPQRPRIRTGLVGGQSEDKGLKFESRRGFPIREKEIKGVDQIRCTDRSSLEKAVRKPIKHSEPSAEFWRKIERVPGMKVDTGHISFEAYGGHGQDTLRMGIMEEKQQLLCSSSGHNVTLGDKEQKSRGYRIKRIKDCKKRRRRRRRRRRRSRTRIVDIGVKKSPIKARSFIS
ncbi:hypothetical protein PPACK8108_LOCUS1482 [Phakopsora pachyrhizi]|uniref:Uncharacterized protein n=1 Tax=Phakopsora pachyrhizi TaxID=170000 RepID=A0AAV0AGI2_PHAPC|nr:hypothetical protein PPACK8108_LOCUS1482 [Phakopsora pachyrhizi]